MAIPWLTLLKTVPWTEVIANAPKVADGARRLWNSVSGKPSAAAAPRADGNAAPAPEGGAQAAIESELRALKTATAELHRQMLAGTELINELAEQNAALIQRIELCRVRQRRLTAGVALALLLALAGLGLAWTG